MLRPRVADRCRPLSHCYPPRNLGHRPHAGTATNRNHPPDWSTGSAPRRDREARGMGQRDEASTDL
eukprot:11562310-Prorocentrum_lima.AAC.1